MLRLLMLVVCLECSGTAQAQERPSLFWWSSMAAQGAASSADAVTSLGRYELNPALRGAGGQFDPHKAALLKGATFVATVVPEALLLRRYPRFSKMLAVVNFGIAGVYGWTAFHNTTVPNLKNR